MALTLRPVLLLIGVAALGLGCRTLRPRPIYEIPMTDVTRQSRLLRGFYEISDGARFTARTFAVSLDTLPTPRAAYLELDCYVPPDMAEDFRTMTLIATVNGSEVGRQTFYQPGHYIFTRYVPVQALKRSPAEVAFELDKSFTEGATGRVIGLSVHSVGFREYEQTAEYRETQMYIARQGFQEAAKQRRLEIPPAKEQELMQLFERLPAWQSLRFQGVKVSQNPLDLWMTQQIIYEIQPDFIILTGAREGGAALSYAGALNGMGLDRSRILAVDAQEAAADATSRPLWKRWVEYFRGDSTDPGIVTRLKDRTQRSKTMVILDSPDRRVDRVLEELRVYSPLVSRGAYLIVGSTYLDGVPARPGTGPGPYEAVRRFLDEGGAKDFEPDSSREMLVLTFSPGGWLRRK
jgi:cephalosporin hydroxylase